MAPQKALKVRTDKVIKVCETCGRFRRYDSDDAWCLICGFDTLSAECACGRDFDYALDEPEAGPMHCPRCGKDWRGAKET